GCGPLVLLVARQLRKAGVNIRAVVDTTPDSNWRQALRHLPGALTSPSYLIKGIAMMASLAFSRTSWFRGATGLEILGSERVTAISFSAGQRTHHIEADTILLHNGVIPNHQISQLMRVEHRWKASQ